MAETTPTPNINQSLGSKTPQLLDPSTMRLWPGEVIDRYVVGRMYRDFDLDDSCTQLRLAYSDFANLTSAELQHFEDHVLAKRNIVQRWRSITSGDAEVQKVLGDIAKMILVQIRLDLLKTTSRAETTPTPNKNKSVESNTPELLDPSTMRLWPGQAIDRYVVGRMYRGYDFNDSCLHLRLAFSDFANICNAELLNFEHHVLAATNIVQRWRCKTSADDEVQRVLRDITQTILVQIRMGQLVDGIKNITKIIVDATERLTLNDYTGESERLSPAE